MITFIWYEPYSEVYIVIVASSICEAREKYAAETPLIFNAPNQIRQHSVVFNTSPTSISEGTTIVIGK